MPDAPGFVDLPTIQDEGVDQPRRGKTNYVGGGVTAVDDPANGRTNVTVPGGTAIIAEQKRSLWLPAGAIDETFERKYLVTAAGFVMTSGTLQLAGGCAIPAGQPVTNISFRSTNAFTTCTHIWFCLVRQTDLAVLAKTADDLSASWLASTDKTLAIAGGPFTPAAAVAVYLGIVVVAGTMGTLRGLAMDVQLNGKAPQTAGPSNAGLTDPTSLGANAAALGAVPASLPYAWLS